MRDERPLAALMAGQRVLISGDGSIAQTAARRFTALDVPVVQGSGADAGATDAIVIWEPAPATPDELGACVQELTALLEAGGLRRALLMVGDPGAVAARVAQTLTIYAAAHLVQQQTRFNTLLLPASPTAAILDRAIDTAVMLLCGRMDAVHGQVLTVTETAEVRA